MGPLLSLRPPPSALPSPAPPLPSPAPRRGRGRCSRALRPLLGHTKARLHGSRAGRSTAPSAARAPSSLGGGRAGTEMRCGARGAAGWGGGWPAAPLRPGLERSGRRGTRAAAARRRATRASAAVCVSGRPGPGHSRPTLFQVAGEACGARDSGPGAARGPRPGAAAPPAARVPLEPLGPLGAPRAPPLLTPPLLWPRRSVQGAEMVSVVPELQACTASPPQLWFPGGGRGGAAAFSPGSWAVVGPQRPAPPGPCEEGGSQDRPGSPWSAPGRLRGGCAVLGWDRAQPSAGQVPGVPACFAAQPAPSCQGLLGCGLGGHSGAQEVSAGRLGPAPSGSGPAPLCASSCRKPSQTDPSHSSALSCLADFEGSP